MVEEGDVDQSSAAKTLGIKSRDRVEPSSSVVDPLIVSFILSFRPE